MTRDETPETVSVRPHTDAQAVDSVIEGWSRLFAYLVVAIAAGLAVMMPFPGLLLALAGASYLRAGDVHARRHPGGLLRLLAGPLTAPVDMVRGVIGTLVTVPYAAVLAAAVPLAIMAVAALDVTVHPLIAAAWGAGGAAYMLLAAPGVRAPCRQLVRIFRELAHEPRRIAAVGTLLCAVTLAVLAGSIALRPSFAPMYELKNSISQVLTRFQDTVQQRVS